MSSLSFILTPLLIPPCCWFLYTCSLIHLRNRSKQNKKSSANPAIQGLSLLPSSPSMRLGYSTALISSPPNRSQHSTLPPTQVWSLLLTVSSSLSPPFRNFWFSCLLTFQENLVSLNQPSLKLFPYEHDNFCIIFSERRGGCRKWPVPTNCIWKFQHREVAVENHH